MRTFSGLAILSRQVSLAATTLVLLLLVRGANADGDASRPVSVCQLFENLEPNSGRMIAVRGIYWYGLRQSCSRAFITGDHKWPSALNLVDSEYAKANGMPVPFKTDDHSWRKLDGVVINEAATGRKEEIWVTVVGQLRAPRAYVRGDGRVVGGYGHLGVFPAELVVHRILDIAVDSTPTYDYREMVRRSTGGGPKE
jgi:hypothetical protein